VIEKPGILPAAPPPAAAFPPGVSLLHVAQAMVSAWALGIEVTAQEANMSADTGELTRVLNFMDKLLRF
jgi:hypothetical protein